MSPTARLLPQLTPENEWFWTSGEGRTHGFGFIHEAVLQLRDEAGDHQVPDATTAVVATGGGTPSGVVLLPQWLTDEHRCRGGSSA